MNSTLRTRVTVPLAIVIALGITPALAGCMGNPIEGIIEQATGGNVDLGGTSLPEGFPSEVPVLDGEIQFGGSLGDGEGNTVYNVTLHTTGDSPVDALKADLEGAGFEAQTEFSGDNAEGGTLIYSTDQWGVLAVVAKDDTGWIINYTVTSAQSGN